MLIILVSNFVMLEIFQNKKFLNVHTGKSIVLT